jgi:hypothetical protein
VTDGGGATYSIPLRVPDGAGGLQPQLALQYGGSGNGSVGVGWALTGLSSIGPCHKTRASEGSPDGIDFDDTDAYCMDGQKLVGPYFESADGAVKGPVPDDGDAAHKIFSTERKTRHRIVAHYAKVDDLQPYSFTVYRQDAQIWTYLGLKAMRLQSTGETTLPKFDEKHTVFPVYLLTQQEDQTGANAITYDYDIGFDSQTPGDFSYRIKKITYTAPPSQKIQLTPRRWILFQYKARKDPIISYMSGVRTVVRSRLESVEAYAPNPTDTQRVWTYKLGSNQSPWTGRSVLAHISCPINPIAAVGIRDSSTRHLPGPTSTWLLEKPSSTTYHYRGHEIF